MFDTATHSHDLRDITIRYWLHLLKLQPFVRLYFLPPSKYDKLAHMTVAPLPDTLIRIFMMFSGSSHYDPRCQGKLPRNPPQHKGRVVVEWGGMPL